MKSVNVYLSFDGDCRQAFDFYKQCFGGQLHTMTFSEIPCDQGKFPPGSENRIMHAALINGPAVLMGADIPSGMPFQKGDNFTVSISCRNNEEVDQYCDAFAQGGRVTMPPQETFFAHRFGMCTDRFGIKWMFLHEKPMPA